MRLGKRGQHVGYDLRLHRERGRIADLLRGEQVAQEILEAALALAEIEAGQVAVVEEAAVLLRRCGDRRDRPARGALHEVFDDRLVALSGGCDRRPVADQSAHDHRLAGRANLRVEPSGIDARHFLDRGRLGQCAHAMRRASAGIAEPFAARNWSWVGICCAVCATTSRMCASRLQRFGVGQEVGGGMVAAGLDPLADQDRQPARLGEELVMLAENPPGGAEHRQLFRQPLRRGEVAAIIPERRIVARRGVVMQHQEVADVDVFAQRLVVEALDFPRSERPRREQRHQPRDGRLDEMDRGRLERFEETAGKPQRDHVLLPRPGPVARRKAQLVGLGQRLAVEIGEQQAGRFVLAHVLRAIDMAVADPVLQRDAPLPPRRPRRRAGQRFAITGQRAGYGDGAVARQPLAPVGERHAKFLPDQQRAEARAVDEKLAFDACAAFQDHGRNEAALTIALDRSDPAFGPLHALALCPPAQVAGIAPGIELEGIGELARAANGDCRGRGHAIFPAFPAAMAIEYSSSSLVSPSERPLSQWW